MIIDVLIVLIVLGAAWVAFQRGLIQPLLAELLALGTLLIIYHNRSGFLGLWVQTIFGIALCYLLISGMIVMDKTFTPISTPTVNVSQLQTIERQLSSNLFTAGLVDSHDLQPYQAQATKAGSVQLADLPAIGQFQNIYKDFVKPQLAGSRLAPAVMSIGHRIPGLGHLTSKDLPKKR